MNVIRNLRCWLKAGSNHFRISGQNKDEADVQVNGSLMEEDVHIYTHLTTHGSDN
jgi:gamma-glutamylcysteine synthetase